MNIKALADYWKSILSAVLVTVSMFGVMLVWLDNRIAGHIDAGLASTAIQFERQAVAFNILVCEIKEIAPLDCDPYDGVPER